MQHFWEAFLENLVFMLVVLPVFGAWLVLMFSQFGIESIRRTVLTNVLLTFSLSVLMVANYDPNRRSDAGTPELMQMKSSLRWLAEVKRVEIEGTTPQGVQRTARHRFLVGPNVRLGVGVDGISLWFIPLTTLLMIPAVLASRETDRKHPAVYYALLLLLESGMIGVFAAIDVILFCVFLEFTLLPLFLLIGWWGGYQRRRVVGKLFLYNLAGSLFIFLGMIAVVLAHSRMRATRSNPQPALTFSTEQLIQGADGVPGIRPLVSDVTSAARQHWDHVSPWIFLALLVGFAVKIPLFPFHTWLPAANLEAPPAVSILLMGVSLKFGCYGFLRFLLPLFPEQCAEASGFVSTVALVGVVYAALLALVQNDVKKLATYVCLSQIGLCVAGIFSLNTVGIAGGMLQLINVGLSIGVVLFAIGLLERRYQTRDLKAFGGLAGPFPRLSLLLTLAVLSLAGVPGLNGFAGETLTLLGIFRGGLPMGVNPIGALAGLIGSLLVAWALLWLLHRAFRGPFHPPGRHVQPADLSDRDVAALLPAALLMVWIGVCPQFFLSRIEPSVAHIVSVYKSDGGAANDPSRMQMQSSVGQAFQPASVGRDFQPADRQWQAGKPAPRRWKACPTASFKLELTDR